MKKRLTKNVIDRIKRRFTVAEEWDIIGMGIPVDDEDKDITLF